MAIEEINHNPIYEPQHYKSGDVETIEIIEQLTKDYEPEEAYIAGNIIKYLARANHKGNKEDDLLKMANYAHRLAHGEWSNTVEEKLDVPDSLISELKRSRAYLRISQRTGILPTVEKLGLTSEDYVQGRLDAYDSVLTLLDGDNK